GGGAETARHCGHRRPGHEHHPHSHGPNGEATANRSDRVVGPILKGGEIMLRLLSRLCMVFLCLFPLLVASGHAGEVEQLGSSSVLVRWGEVEGYRGIMKNDAHWTPDTDLSRHPPFGPHARATPQRSKSWRLRPMNGPKMPRCPPIPARRLTCLTNSRAQ